MVRSKSRKTTPRKKPSNAKNLADLVRSQNKNGHSDLQVLDKEPDLKDLDKDLIDEEDLFEDPETDNGDGDGDGDDKGPKLATDAQIYAAKLYKERQQRIAYMNRCGNLEDKLSGQLIENGRLVRELSIARRELNKMLVDKMNEENTVMFKRVGLKEGDRVTDQVEGKDGWYVVQGK